MEADSWLDNLVAFKSELQKLADSPMYSEEQNVGDEMDPSLEDDDELGYVYHSQDGIMMRNNQDAKAKIDDLKKRAKKKK